MVINQNDTDGFKISIKSVRTEDSDTGAPVPISATRLGEHIAQFIESALVPRQALHILVSLEKWDKTFVLEESVYRILLPERTGQNNDYSRNYWIETTNN